jgi:hypothetical protein
MNTIVIAVEFVDVRVCVLIIVGFMGDPPIQNLSLATYIHLYMQLIISNIG